MADLRSRLEADFSSFQAAVDGVTAKIKSMEAGATDAEKSLTRVGNTFSGTKVISEATLMTKAIADAGGASTLTAKEMARVNTTVTEAIEKYGKLGGTAPKSMTDLAEATKQSTKATDEHAVSFGTLVGSYVTAQAIIGAVKGTFNALVGEVQASVKAANEAEKANVQMVAALRAQGTAVPSVITAFQGYAEALQNTTIYQDDAIEGAIALLVQVGNVMPRDMKKALEATTNLASGLGKDLTSATMLVAKAAEGNTGALKKAGVVIDETRAKQEGFGYVLDQITEKFGGQAAAIAGTYEGRLTQLGNTWNNVEESIGRVITQNATLLGAFDLVNRSIAANTGELNRNNATNEIVSSVVIGVAKSFSFLLQAVDYLQTGYAALRFGSDAVIAGFLGVGVAVLDTATAIGTYTKYVNPVAWTGAWKTGMKELADQSTFLKGAIKGLEDDSKQAIKTSTEWGNGIQGLKGKIDGFATELEKTRGKTVALKTATDDSTNAWSRNTTAVGKASTVVDEHAKKLAAVNLKIADANRDIGKLTESQQASVASYKAIGLSNDEMATKLGISALAIKRFDDDTKAASDAAKKFSDELVKNTEAAKKNEPALAGLSQTVGVLETREKDIAEAAIKAYDAFKKLDAEIFVIERSAFLFNGTLSSTTEGLEKLGEKSGDPERVKEALGHATEAAKEFNTSIDDLAKTFVSAFTGGGGLSGAIKGLGVQITNDLFKPILAGMTAAQQAAIKAGTTSAAVGAGAVAAGASWQTALGGVALSTGTIFASAAASTAGITAGTIALGAATFGIGAAAVGVALLAKHYLTVSKNEKDARLEFEKYQKNFGTLDEMITKVGAAYASMGLTGTQAQHDINAALDATHHSAQDVHDALVTINDVLIASEEREKAIQAVTDKITALGSVITEVGVGLPDFLQPMLDDMLAMPGITADVSAAITGMRDSATPDFAKLEALAKTYGGTIDQLGPKFKQAHTTADAGKWITDIEKLIAAGADYTEVLGFMKDEAQAIVTQSRLFGTTIPENMKGYLQSLIASGELLDENKDAITDISALKFGAAVKTDVDKLKDAIELLAKAIEGIPGKLSEISKVKIPPIHIPVIYDAGPVPDGVPALSSARGTVLPFAPRVVTPVLARVSTGVGAGRSASDARVEQVIARLERTLDDLPRAFAVRVASAIALKPRAS